MRSSLYLLLFLLIPPFLLLLQLQPVAGMPGEASIGWKASNLVASVGNFANELTKDSKKAVSVFKKIHKFSGKFAKFASVIGASFAFIGEFILDDSDPKHEELLAEFNKMDGAIENLNLKLDGIKDLIKHEHAMTRLNIHLTELQTIITTYKLYVNGEDFGNELINYHSLNKIKGAIIGIYLNAEKPAETLSDLTNGNWNSVARLYSYLRGILFEGITAYTTACSLYENSTRVEKENAVDKCMNKSELLFKNYTIQFDDNFNQVLNSCIHNYKDNIKKMVAAEHQQLCSRPEGNEAFAKRISKKISEEYFWVDAVVIVYNEVLGFDKHCVLADYVKFRTCKKNVVIFMDSKPDYRNPHKPRMLKQAIQCSPKSIVEKYLHTIKGRFIKNDAEVFHGEFKEKTGSLFGKLAVIRPGEQMCAEPTDYNGRYYSVVLSQYPRFSIIGQLLDSSIYTRCPYDFPFAFDSGNFCQKRLVEGRELWSNAWMEKQMDEETTACPSKPCQDAAHCHGITETGDGWRFVEKTVQPSTSSIAAPASDHTKCCTTCQAAAPDTTMYIFNKNDKRCYCRKHLMGVTPITIQENGQLSNFCYGNTGYVSLGCWKDTSNRAIATLEGTDSRLAGNYWERKNALELCFEVAISKGYRTFAVQNGGWCAASSTARETYKKYGAASNCASGKGGAWANDVYKIQECSDLLRVSAEGTKVYFLSGIWKYHSQYGGRPVYKMENVGYYLFHYINRWVVEPEIGRHIHETRGYELFGYIRFEGNIHCPGNVGNRWKEVYSRELDQRISITEKLWRDDGRCGVSYPLPNGKPGQCDPTANANEKGPCCSSGGWCGNSVYHCKCSSCVSYAARGWSKIIHTGEVTGIAIKDNRLYGVGTDKKIWKHFLNGSGGWWKIIHTGETTGIAIKDNRLYGVGTDKKIWKHFLSGSGGWWKIIHTGEVTGIAIKDNDLYAVGMDKKIWKHSLSGSGSWSKIIHTGEVTAIAIKDNDLYAVGMDKKIWKHSLSGSGSWSKIIHTGDVTAIAIKDNELYAVGMDKQIWKHYLFHL